MKTNKCKSCKWYVGKTPSKKGNPVFGGSSHVHCRRGYSCDAFSYETGASRELGDATYSLYESGD